jgi:hypothetical protein
VPICSDFSPSDFTRSDSVQCVELVNPEITD